MISKVREGKIKFLEVENRTSRKTGKAYQMVVVVDLDTYEKFEYFKRDELVLDGISNGDLVYLTFEHTRRGFNINTDLVNIEKAK